MVLAARAEVDAKEVDPAAPENGWGGGGLEGWAARLMYERTRRRLPATTLTSSCINEPGLWIFGRDDYACRV